MVWPFTRARFETGCTIEVEHSQEALHAHVRLDGDIPINPGDRVRVHGPPVKLRFGESLTLRRAATVERAGLIERQLTRLSAWFQLKELYEVSFSDGSLT
jgi:hypothetical protein